MNKMPIGKMSSAKVLKAPAEGAATAADPRSATSTASETPITVCVERDTMIGQASVNSEPSETGRRGEGASAALKGRQNVAQPRPLAFSFDLEARAERVVLHREE